MISDTRVYGLCLTYCTELKEFFLRCFSLSDFDRENKEDLPASEARHERYELHRAGEAERGLECISEVFSDEEAE